MNPIFKIVVDALSDAKKDLVASLSRVGEARVRMYVERATLAIDCSVLEIPAQRVGEYTLEQARAATAEPDASIEDHLLEAMLDAVWDEGYQQACEDLATQITAYERGLN